jgi:hypothetical protein
VAARFVADGWDPSFVFTPEADLVSGAEHVGTREGMLPQLAPHPWR